MSGPPALASQQGNPLRRLRVGRERIPARIAILAPLASEGEHYLGVAGPFSFTNLEAFAVIRH